MASNSFGTIESDIAATRARLDETIGLIQDKLTLTGLVDEAMAQAGVQRFESGPDFLLGLLRRYPIPVMVAAAGVGWLMYRSNRDRAHLRGAIEDANYVELSPASRSAPAISAANDGHARSYDPDRPPRHPSTNPIEPGRVLESQS